MTDYHATDVDHHESTFKETTTPTVEWKDEKFQRGDRVVVSVQGRRRHGHTVAVGSQTCAIHFDSGNGMAKFHTVLVSPSRMQREQPLSDHENQTVVPLSCTIQNRATATHGALVHGRAVHDACPSTIYNAAAMNGIMHLIRWMAATHSYSPPPPQSNESKPKSPPYSNLSLAQIQQLPSDDCHALNEIAICNWDRRIDSSRNSDNNDETGVRDRLVQYFRREAITTGFMFEALSDSRALRSWQRGIQFDFWFVGKDDTGTYVVPDCPSHEHVVYKVVGFGGGPTTTAATNDATATRAPVRLIRVPMCLRMTLVPWYGRLLHDTSVPLPREKESIRMATDPRAAHRLHTVVLQAIENATVVEYFAELEPL